jgi:hypothetical protein
MNFSNEKIEAMIYTINGHKVMLDSDLAKLYGVETKRLIEQVKRNLSRFPNDFLIICNSSDMDDLRSQIATANIANSWNHKRRTPPMLFTENGVAMLSTVLNSERAIQVNIAIMRTFTKLRSFLAMESSLDGRISSLEKNTHKLFKIVFERLDNIEDQVTPKLPANRKRIGLKQDLKE